MPTEPTDGVPSTGHSPPLLQRLSGVLRTVPDLSSRSNTKWHAVNALLAREFGLPERKVKTYYASELKQATVRLAQPGVANDRPSLGMLLVGADASIDRYAAKLRPFVNSPHPFEAILVGTWNGTELELRYVVARESSSLAPVARDAIPGLGLLEVPVVAEGGDALAARFPAAKDVPPVYEVYDVEQFSMETGVPPDVAQAWCDTLRRKGQLILQGPPGTGKTHIATRLAKLIASKTGGFTDTVVFHSSYSYADFVAGLAPRLDREGRLSYDRVPGKLLQFADEAGKRPDDALSVLLIDEINRADLSSVFGELMYALEYRGAPVSLAHGPGDGVFRLPPNVLIIGTMNTADRSVASFDHALRRRFAFVRLEPDYAALEAQLRAADVPPDPLVSLLRDVNEQIRDPNYFLGISFFISAGMELPALFDDIWSTEVYPYLEELFRGREELLQRFATPAVKTRYLASWYVDERPGS